MNTKWIRNALITHKQTFSLIDSEFMAKTILIISLVPIYKRSLFQSLCDVSAAESVSASIHDNIDLVCANLILSNKSSWLRFAETIFSWNKRNKECVASKNSQKIIWKIFHFVSESHSCITVFFSFVFSFFYHISLNCSPAKRF